MELGRDETVVLGFELIVAVVASPDEADVDISCDATETCCEIEFMPEVGETSDILVATVGGCSGTGLTGTGDAAADTTGVLLVDNALLVIGAEFVPPATV